MELVVGGKYHESGQLEAYALKQLGLKPENSVVDVGCGTGRLAVALERFLAGNYCGTDILSESLDYARRRCRRADWNFLETRDNTIPVLDQSADFVVFFSVFTHLLDEDIFRYLLEARRIAKSTAKIVFSYLDFECEAHWPLFLQTAANRETGSVLNKFTTETAIRRLARGAGLKVNALYSGQQRWISVDSAIVCEDGRELLDLVGFGQSVAVLDVFPEKKYLALYPDVRQAVEAGVFYSGSHHYDVCGHKEGRET